MVVNFDDRLVGGAGMMVLAEQLCELSQSMR